MSFIIEKLRDLVLRLGFVREAMKLIWDASSMWTLTWLLILLVQGTLPAAIVYLTKWLVDSVAAIMGVGSVEEAVSIVIVPVILMGAALLLQRVLSSVSEWVGVAQSELVQDHIKNLIHAKAASIDYAFYESSGYYDLLDRANSQSGSRVLTLLQNVGGLLQSAVTLVSIAAILLQYTWWLPLVLVASTLPAFQVLLRHNQRYHAWWHRTTTDRRWTQYFDLMLTNQAAAAEVRLNDLGSFFRTRYWKLRERLRNERIDLVRKQAIAKLLAGFMALVATAATMGWIVLQAIRGAATLGDLALFYQAFNQGQSLTGTIFRNMGEIYTNTLFLEHLFMFLHHDEGMTDPADPQALPRLREGVTFDKVTFTYPGQEHPALEDFNLHIPAGKITAIVGENGAGKSTLVKLMCRFYDPDEGTVRLDGVDLRDFNRAQLRRQISVMFQFPVRYQLQADLNIRMGDLDGPHDRAAVESAAQSADADAFIRRLPKGYDTQLGRYFEHGAELSGGEWQRVALARAFLRRAQVIVLDEPTSSMDSWAENDWLDRFKKLVEGQTTLIITHRFTTAMRADVIHVMIGGRVVESGSHAELLEQNGRYAASWKAQTQANQYSREVDIS